MPFLQPASTSSNILPRTLIPHPRRISAARPFVLHGLPIRLPFTRELATRPKILQTPEGSLYSRVPLRSFKRSIVVLYKPDDEERARAVERSILPPSNRTHTRTHPACLPRCPYYTGSPPVERAAARSVLRRRLGR